MVEDIIHSAISNKNSFVSKRKWTHGNITTEIKNGLILITNKDTGQIIELPSENWHSLVMFLSETFLLSQYNDQEIEFSANLKLTIYVNP